MADELYCRIFVDTEMEEADILALIAETVSGVIRHFVVQAPGMQIDVLQNDDYDPGEGRRRPDGHTHYRYYVDIFSDLDEVSHAAMQRHIAALVEAFRARHAPAVPVMFEG